MMYTAPTRLPVDAPWAADAEFSTAELVAAGQSVERETLLAMVALLVDEIGPRAVLQEVL